MASDVDIANSALMDMKQPSISSLDQDTGSARTIKAVFEEVRDWVLEQHPWNFARARATLAQLGSTPLYGYKRAFQLPNDFLTLLGTEPDLDVYRVEDGTLLCDVETVNISYIRRVTNPRSMPPHFRAAFAAFLAAKTAATITGSEELRKYLEALAAARLSSARHANSLSSGEDEPERPCLFINARLV